MNAPHTTHGLLNTAGFAHPSRNVVEFGIQAGMTIADFGAGSGAYVFEIAAFLEGDGTVYAIDVQRDLLKKIHNEAHKRGLKSVRILWGDLETPGGSKMPDTSCDRVLISNILFQLEDKNRVFSEADRILKNDGKLIVIDWEESFGGMGPVAKAVVNKAAALQIAQSAGFQLVKEFPAGAHHYGLIFERARNR